MRYTMEVMESGIILKGPVPLEQMGQIRKIAKSLDFDIMDIGLSQALGATMVITNEAGSLLLRSELDEANKGKGIEESWICGCDTGTSSKTIFAVMRGTKPNDANIPYDPDDFGRCYRLLKLIPEWRPRLGEVAAKYPRWSGLVEHWDELTAMYEAKQFKPMYALMNTLRS